MEKPQMNDPSKANQELLEEISSLKKRIQELEKSDAEHKQEEKTLKENNDKFLSLASTIPGNIAYVNANTLQYEFVNDTFEKSFGIPREKIIGQHIKDIIGEANYKFAIKYIEEVRLGKSISYENTFDLVSGKRWIQVNYTPVTDANGLVVSIAVLSLDITERKKAEEALRNSEVQLRAVLDATPFPIALVDTQDNNIDFWSRSALTLFGHTAPTAPEWYQLAYPDPDYQREVINRWKPFLEIARESRKTVNTGEYRVTCKDGSERICELYATFLKDKLIVTFNDVTERKRAAEALQKSEEKYRTLIETTQTGFVILDHHGIVLDANPEYVGLTGHSQLSDILGSSVLEWTANHEKEKNAAAVEICCREGLIRNLEIDYMDSKGHVTPIELNATCMEVEGKTEIMTLCRNITARRQAEQELQKLVSIVRHSSELINLATPDGRMIFLNEAGCWMLGIEPDRVDEFNIQDVIPEHLLKMVRTELLPALTRDGAWEGELQYRNLKTGRLTDVYASTYTIADPVSKASLYFANVSRDITERKKAEEEREKFTERLQRAEKMEALGTLAGGVAHDLNNVLGILVGYSELLLDDIPLENRLRSHVEKIMGGGVRAAAIVQDLLTLARRGIHSASVFNLNSIISDFQKTLEFENLSLSHPHVQTKTNLATDLLNINGSPPHISKSFMNLLTNAVEAMPSGGTLTVTTGNCNLDGPIHGYDDVREGDYVFLSVSDTGEGISDEDIKHIFEPFYTKKVMGRSGTGLGLAVVWGVVKDHNGYIGVQKR
ncbi:MAG: hybrid sensor histidine kinase/response regulator [Deltaproteobacteria bacterium]|nr:hybrid sensor histidine kinase/response regulator [Deltaproteobacteria bacterium]